MKPTARRALRGLPFDKQTKLLQRWSGTVDGTKAEVSYTYGGKDIQGVRDLGVPGDAKVRDRREKIAQEAGPLLDRLDSRLGAKEHLGNYVAIHTRTIVPDVPNSRRSKWLWRFTAAVTASGSSASTSGSVNAS